jgi:hypothetical protein
MMDLGLDLFDQVFVLKFIPAYGQQCFPIGPLNNDTARACQGMAGIIRLHSSMAARKSNF